MLELLLRALDTRYIIISKVDIWYSPWLITYLYDYEIYKLRLKLGCMDMNNARHKCDMIRSKILKNIVNNIETRRCTMPNYACLLCLESYQPE